MEHEMFVKLILSGTIVLTILLLFLVLKNYARNTQRKFGIRKSRYVAIRRILRIFSVLFGAVALLLVWDVNLKSMWVHITGFLAVIAIAFFAVWSLLENLLAGIIPYFTSPFKIEDEIEVMPDDVCGTVLAINTFYTVLQDDRANDINIPNSLFFQKYIRVKAGDSNPFSRTENLHVSEDED